MTVSNLYLFRHGIAEGEHPDFPGKDAERRLTEKGHERTVMAGRGISRLGIVPDVVWTSPYRRAWQTAQILAEALSPAEGVVVQEELACDGHNDAVVKLIAGAEARTLLVVGHEPNLSELVSLLACGRGILRMRLKKAGLVHLELHPVHQRLVGRLQSCVPPRILRLLGGADDDERE